jgi:GGDEF domain-containing protein
MGTQNNGGKSETSVAGAVVAAICIVIYLGALVQAAVRFYLSLDQRGITAEQEFDAIVQTALEDGKRGFMDEQFIETVNNALAATTSIEALIISGPEGEYAFERQKGYAVNWVNNSPRFIDRLGFSNKNYYKPLQINDLRNANIKAVARAFDYNELSKILKETLLIILAGFALSFFTMLVQLITGAGPEKAEPDQENGAFETDKQTDIGIADTESGPKGLYSARSNIGWEEYTKDRLDSELHRCSSTEKDITLIYMDFTDIKNDTMYRQAAEEAVVSITSRDLLFEYGKYGVCAILPGVNLETGISKAEKFYQRISQKFHGGRNASSLRIGLSSRSGRLLNAGRLMKEAAEALNRAKKDPKSPIIAFKSDLDRYRTFIASQN